MKHDCPHLKDTVAVALHPDGLNAMAPKLREHFHICPACQTEFAATQALAARLRQQTPESLPSSSLTQRILAALPPEAAKPRPAGFKYLRLSLAAAIPLVMCAGLITWHALRHLQPESPAVNPTLSQCAWLLDQQESDGLWRPQSSGGSPTYRPAISALTTLALFRHAQPHYELGIARAQTALFNLQQPSGAFDTSTTRAYNHGIVTTALLAMRADPVHDTQLRHAISFIITSQQPSGGWGYSPSDTPNTAVTAWQLEALSRAAALGWNEAQAPLNRGLRWLRARATPSGHFAYQETTVHPAATTATIDAIAVATLFSAGKAHPELVSVAHQSLEHLASASQRQIDYYRDYFMARAYTQSGDTKRAEAVTARMSSHLYPGLQDRWGAVGGDLYTTALTLLAIN